MFPGNLQAGKRAPPTESYGFAARIDGEQKLCNTKQMMSSLAANAAHEFASGFLFVCLTCLILFWSCLSVMQLHLPLLV